MTDMNVDWARELLREAAGIYLAHLYEGGDMDALTDAFIGGGIQGVNRVLNIDVPVLSVRNGALVFEDTPVVHPFTGTPYEPYDGDGNVEAICCGQPMKWLDCAECEGTGIGEYEDGGTELCDTCNGEGGDYVCENCGYTGRELRVQQELNQREE